LNAPHESLVDSVLDSLEIAKETTSILPPLPPNIKHIHIKALNAIYRVRDEEGNARITDINNFLRFLFSNTTKIINELCSLGLVEKVAHSFDRRVVLVHTTELGEQMIEKCIISYHPRLQKEFEKLGEADCAAMAESIKKVYAIIKKVYKNDT
jgi:DNA-binding MarR family transcriptional regulator